MGHFSILFNRNNSTIDLNKERIHKQTKMPKTKTRREKEKKEKEAVRFNKKGALRAKLNSKKVIEIRKYAQELGIRQMKVKGSKEYKTKEVFIDEIVEKVEKQNKKLYVDWMTRVDKGKSIWRQTIINPSHDYSLENSEK